MAYVNSNGYIVPDLDIANSLRHTTTVAWLPGSSTTIAATNGGAGYGASFTGGVGGTSGAGGVGGTGGSFNFIGGAGGATNGNGGCVRLGGGLGSGTGGNGGVIHKVADMTGANIDIAANGTASPKQLLNGYITVGTGAGAGYTVTTPTGAELSAALPGAAAGDSFEVMIHNSVAQIMTWTAGASGMTVRGTATLAASTPSVAKFLCTGTNTWVTWLMKNA